MFLYSLLLDCHRVRFSLNVLVICVGRRNIAPPLLTSVLGRGERSTSRPCGYTPGERGSGTHWIGGWVGCRLGRDATENNRLSLPRLESQFPIRIKASNKSVTFCARTSLTLQCTKQHRKVCSHKLKRLCRCYYFQVMVEEKATNM
jgi:hypothetical protein